MVTRGAESRAGGMEDAVADNEEGAFARWSRLKRAGLHERNNPEAGRPTQPVRAQDASPPESTGNAGAASATAREHGTVRTDGDVAPPDPRTTEPTQEPRPCESPQDLPPLSSLTRDSDFTRFMRADVPEEIRRQALRTLWRSDPVLACLDGLNDYDEDYSHVRTLSQVVRTAYRVGSGYSSDDTAEAGSRDERNDLPPCDPHTESEGEPSAAEAGSPRKNDPDTTEMRGEGPGDRAGSTDGPGTATTAEPEASTGDGATRGRTIGDGTGTGNGDAS